MKQLAICLLGLGGLAALAGCHTPMARLNTLQDASHPVTRQSKIALPPNPQDQPDLPTRLAGEVLAAQMRALGFSLAPPADAEFLATYKVTIKDVPESYTRSVPTIAQTYGTSINGNSVSGTTFGEQIVPQTRMVSTIFLEMSLQTAAEPKLTVWQGQISISVEDQQSFNIPFYRALLAYVGQTFTGEVNLKDYAVPAKQR